MKIFYCIEDELSRAVAQKIISDCCPPGTETQELGKAHGGFGYIKNNLKKFHSLSQRAPVLIITDLDNNICAPSLRNTWLTSVGIQEPLPNNMLFCIAQTEIESWLLADTKSIGNLLSINPAQIQTDIEMTVLNSKEYLVRLAKRFSSADVRNDLVPHEKSKAATGINYNYRLSQFVTNAWHPKQAASNSISLNRAITKLSLLMP